MYQYIIVIRGRSFTSIVIESIRNNRVDGQGAAYCLLSFVDKLNYLARQLLLACGGQF